MTTTASLEAAHTLAQLDALTTESVYGELRIRRRRMRRHRNLREFEVELWFAGDRAPTYRNADYDLQAAIDRTFRNAQAHVMRGLPHPRPRRR